MVPALPQRQRVGRKPRQRGPSNAPRVPSRIGQDYAKALRNLELQRSRGLPRPSRKARQMGLSGRRSRGGSNTKATGAYNARGFPDGLRRSLPTPFSQDEFIGDILGSTTFGATINAQGSPSSAAGLPGNPGQSQSFPWLSLMAPRFEKYVFTKLQYYYKHEVSQFATAGTIGKVIMSFDYDAADSPPTGKQVMMDTDPHVDGMPCEDFVLDVDCREAFNNGPKYVRPGILPGATDIKTYDIGNLFIAGSGNTDAVTKLGELHVRYSGYFQKPLLSQNLSAPQNNSVSVFASVIPTPLTTAVPLVLPLPVSTQANSNGLSCATVNGQVTPPPGNYLVFADVQFINAGNTTLIAQFILQKNGVGVPADTPTFEALLAAGISDVALDFSWFLQMNGTDSLSIQASMSGTGGGLAGNATLVLVAI